MKKSEFLVYTYRYTWKNSEGKLCVKFIVGADIEHKKFMQKLIDAPEVVLASRIYVNTIDCSMLEQHEIIKKEVLKK